MLRDQHEQHRSRNKTSLRVTFDSVSTASATTTLPSLPSAPPSWRPPIHGAPLVRHIDLPTLTRSPNTSASSVNPPPPSRPVPPQTIPPWAPIPPTPTPPTPLLLPLEHLTRLPDRIYHPNAPISSESLDGPYWQNPLSSELESIVERVAALRKKMAEEQIDYFVVPSEDGHLSEYVAPSDKRLQWISGFTGSAGTAIVSKESAYLFVDSRCCIQADREVDPSWQVLKVGTPAAEDWVEWAISLSRGCKIGIDARMVSHKRATRLFNGLCERGSSLVHPPQNLIDLVWSERPKRPKGIVYMQPIEFTDRDVKKKLSDVRKWIKRQNAAFGQRSASRSASAASNERDSVAQLQTSNAIPTRTQNLGDIIAALFISDLASIAYILNLRGNDIPYKSVFTAYLLIGNDRKNILFIESDKINKEVQDYLHENGVSIREYLDVWTFLRGKKWGEGKIIIDPDTPYAVSLMIGPANYVVLPPFIEEMNAVKNPVELGRMRTAYLRHGIAMVRWFAWLEHELSQGYDVSEWEGSVKLNEFRRQGGEEEDGINLYLGLEHDSFVAAGGNAALPRYKPMGDGRAFVGGNEPFLVGSGGQYRDGTRDTTQPIYSFRPTTKQSEAFTKLLQRHIAIDTAVFPAGTNTARLDALTCKALCKGDSACLYETGHGVGSPLTLHRGSHSLQSLVPLKPGHWLTSKLGFYKESDFGVRMLVVKVVQTPNQNEGETWLGFERLNLAPIQMKMVRTNLLSKEEKQWIKDHNQNVRKVLEPYLVDDKRALKWLYRESSEGFLSLFDEPEENKGSQIINTDEFAHMSVEKLINQQVLVDLTAEINIDGCRVVANGGFGVVYHGKLNGKSVAVKVLGACKGTTGTKTETKEERRLRKEMRVWAALDHPNIVKFYGYANGISDLPAMVSKWCENGDAACLREDSGLTPERRVFLAQDVANGLAHLHFLKIIHGDLKPQNVLIDDGGNAQLCDFGLVYLDWEVVSMNTTSSYSGTARYKAHELFPSKGNPFVKPSFSGDVYALGCVIYEFVDQKLPFSDLGSIYELLDAIKDKEAPASRPVDIDQSKADYWDLLEACWNLDPQERPDADDVLAQLRTI